ncbi:MAG: ScyD/ScyE family protein, partial [Acidimicrobiales bacterium]
MAVALAVAMAVFAAPASADSPLQVVASGLDNPRHLSFSPTGALYVVEAGRGGSGPCVEHPNLGEFCLGFTGAVTRVRD